MLIVIVEAYNGTGDNKVKVGEQEAKKPETLDEAVKLYGAASVLKGFWKSEVIDIQRLIRTPLKKELSENERLFKSLSKDEQDRILNNRGGGIGL